MSDLADLVVLIIFVSTVLTFSYDFRGFWSSPVVEKFFD